MADPNMIRLPNETPGVSMVRNYRAAAGDAQKRSVLTSAKRAMMALTSAEKRAFLAQLPDDIRQALQTESTNEA